jgi:hypothetical protein
VAVKNKQSAGKNALEDATSVPAVWSAACGPVELERKGQRHKSLLRLADLVN